MTILSAPGDKFVELRGSNLVRNKTDAHSTNTSYFAANPSSDFLLGITGLSYRPSARYGYFELPAHAYMSGTLACRGGLANSEVLQSVGRHEGRLSSPLVRIY